MVNFSGELSDFLIFLFITVSIILVLVWVVSRLITFFKDIFSSLYYKKQTRKYNKSKEISNLELITRIDEIHKYNSKKTKEL